MPSIEIIKKLADTPLEQWTPNQLQDLIDIASAEIKEWEQVKAEAMRYLPASHRG